MIAMGMRDRDEGNVGGLHVELSELCSELLGTARVTGWSIDWSVGNRIGIAGVPEQPLIAVLDQVAGIRKLNGLADIDVGRPARLVLGGVVAAVHDVETVGGLCCGGAGERACNGQPDQ